MHVAPAQVHEFAGATAFRYAAGRVYNTSPATMGKAIARWMEARGAKKATLGQSIGLDGSGVSRFVKGERFPSVKQLLDIAEALKIEPEDLLLACRAEDGDTTAYSALRQRMAALKDAGGDSTHESYADTVTKAHDHQRRWDELHGGPPAEDPPDWYLRGEDPPTRRPLIDVQALVERRLAQHLARVEEENRRIVAEMRALIEEQARALAAAQQTASEASSVGTKEPGRDPD